MDTNVDHIEMKLEVVIVPVSDVDRAKEFYAKLGWRLDVDFVGKGGRLVQFTPPGSGCSIQFGENITSAPPGSLRGSYLIVSDVAAAREELVRRGIQVSDEFHCASLPCRFGEDGTRLSGPAPGNASYFSFASFNDPDGNRWLLQEVTTRLPGRVDPSTTRFSSSSDVAGALRRASAAHGEHEKLIGHADPNWPDWYADYIVREQSGEKLPT